MQLDLVPPSRELAESYRGLVGEFVERGEKLIPFTLSFPTDPFPQLVERLEACARGEGIPPGFVPHSTYWLVREKAYVVGVSNLRHALTASLKREGGNIGYGVRPSERRKGFGRMLLGRTLDRARLMGMAEVWLTCGRGNVASIRTIVGNGGVLVSEEFIAERGEMVRRYRIELANGDQQGRRVNE